MKNFFIAFFIMAFISGCAMFAEEITRTADSVADGVDRYCEEVVENDRREFREKINPTPGGATITIVCPGDQQSSLDKIVLASARDEYTKEHCGQPVTKQRKEDAPDGMQA